MDEQPPRVYRLRPYYRNAAALGTAFFLLIGIGSTLADQPVEAAITYGLFWGAWTLLGIFLLLAYYRYRLSISDDEIIEFGIFRSQRGKVSQIQEVKWTLKPPKGGVVVIFTYASIKIALNNFTCEERDEIIGFLLDHTPRELHVGQNGFNERFQEEGAEEPGQRWIGPFIALGASACFLAFWVFGGGDDDLLAAIICLGLAFWVAWRWWRDRPSS